MVPWKHLRSDIFGFEMDSTITSIGAFAFHSCINLTSAPIPSGVVQIGNAAFYSCDKLSSITIPDTVTKFGTVNVFGYNSLTSFVVSSDNTEYKAEDGVVFTKDGKTLMFYPCMKSNDYTVPDSVTTIGSYAFSHCRNLASVKFPSALTVVGNRAFDTCDSMKSINLPDGLVEIGICTFYQCSGLDVVLIPKTVTKIGENAFHSCHLKAVAFLGDAEPTAGSKPFNMNPDLSSVCVTSKYKGSKFCELDVSTSSVCAALNDVSECYTVGYDAKQAKWVLVKDEEAWDPVTHKCGGATSRGAVRREFPLLVFLMIAVGILFARH